VTRDAGAANEEAEAVVKYVEHCKSARYEGS
jgi:hypothetical protein